MEAAQPFGTEMSETDDADDELEKYYALHQLKGLVPLSPSHSAPKF